MNFVDDFGYRYGYDDDEQLAPYLTPQEIMELLCIGKNTVYKLLLSGDLKGFRVGRQWRISREELVIFAKGLDNEPTLRYSQTVPGT